MQAHPTDDLLCGFQTEYAHGFTRWVISEAPGHWKIPWAEEPGGLYSPGGHKRGGHALVGLSTVDGTS